VANWTVWPIHTVEFERKWTLGGGFALIGDAAHAMTPFAAQGAAMAIEDAATLAAALAAAPPDATPALAAWEAERRPRIERVIRRGALNRFAWHASGPVALARNLFLKTRSPEQLAAMTKDASVLALGKQTFSQNCAACHRGDAGGQIGPNLTDDYWIHGAGLAEIHKSVADGVLEKGMPPWGKVLKPAQLDAVVAYVFTLHGTNPPNPKAPQGEMVPR